ncbi:hypothetical protein EJ04DRAFT_603155 [Polyplosphaeria fusca]|uniref:Uncharacterized protein n=1 Tax=Polyplosphaeria fusca TaxID=682080 RepID=A0A9P4V1E2_9PLEO|nr:hypothetical protein EJ04DRAFT_603155 [Polyplosphaeria fusca]
MRSRRPITWSSPSTLHSYNNPTKREPSIASDPITAPVQSSAPLALAPKRMAIPTIGDATNMQSAVSARRSTASVIALKHAVIPLIGPITNMQSAVPATRSTVASSLAQANHDRDIPKLGSTEECLLAEWTSNERSSTKRKAIVDDFDSGSDFDYDYRTTTPTSTPTPIYKPPVYESDSPSPLSKRSRVYSGARSQAEVCR